jgi:hypothetical protein
VLDAGHIEDGVGIHGEYQWIVTQHYLADVLRLCPEIVVGKHVAVTSLDSGPLRLSDEEQAFGWAGRNDIAYSPIIQTVSEMPRAGFDEWYVFDKPADLGRLAPQSLDIFEAPLVRGNVHSFVNFGDFNLHQPERILLIDSFWKQLGWICPHTYIAEGILLTIATTDKGLFDAVLSSLRELGNPQGPLL